MQDEKLTLVPVGFVFLSFVCKFQQIWNNGLQFLGLTKSTWAKRTALALSISPRQNAILLL